MSEPQKTLILAVDSVSHDVAPPQVREHRGDLVRGQSEDDGNPRVCEHRLTFDSKPLVSRLISPPPRPAKQDAELAGASQDVPEQVRALLQTYVFVLSATA